MSTLADRLTLAIAHAGINQAELARRVGIKPPSVNGWFSGKAKFLRGENLLAAASALGVDQDWLATGKGEMLRQGGNADFAQVPKSVSPSATTSDYVRVEQLDAEAGMGGEVVNDDYPEVIRAMDFEPDYIRSIVGFVPAPGRLVLVTGTGDSMLPTIQPGDVVVVDRGVTSFDGDGLYLINMGNGHQIKRLIDKGVIHVASDNREKNGDPFAIPSGTVIGGKVYLRNRIERFN